MSKPLTLTMRDSLRRAFAASDSYDRDDDGPEYRFSHWDIDGNQLRALVRRGLAEHIGGGKYAFTLAGLVALIDSEATLQGDKFEAAEAEPVKFEREWMERDARNHESLQGLVDRREANLDRELRKAQEAVEEATRRIAHFNRRYPGHQLLGVGE